MATQILYAVTGIVLARMLSQEDFGLVGALLIFQAFASLIVDSGFSYALIQKKNPTQLDYSSVLWFNIGVASLLYLILFFGAPLIAACFQNDQRLIPLSRLMFLVLILNASASSQLFRLQKTMEVRMVAVSNSVGLAIGGATGIVLAVTGYGAWAIVWQALAHSGVKSIVLWTGCSWRPSLSFSTDSIRSLFSVGSRMMFTSFLNTIFQHIYSFFIGIRVGMAPLGYYTQSDKWSKMAVMSLAQVFTSSFLPPLSAVQNDRERFSQMVGKMNRFTAYLLFPGLIGLMVIATPLFHVLFGQKWDPSIILFQLLLVRGIFFVLNSLYNNYLLALGQAKTIVWLEVLRDVAAISALLAALPFIGMSTDEDPVYGLTLLLWGQVGATVLTWIASLYYTSKASGRSMLAFIGDLAPYFALTGTIVPLMVGAGYLFSSDVVTLAVEIVVAGCLYLGVNYLLGSKIQRDVLAFLRGGKVL